MNYLLQLTLAQALGYGAVIWWMWKHESNKQEGVWKPFARLTWNKNALRKVYKPQPESETIADSFVTPQLDLKTLFASLVKGLSILKWAAAGLSNHHLNAGGMLSDPSNHHLSTGGMLTDPSNHHLNTGGMLTDPSDLNLCAEQSLSILLNPF